MKAIFILNSLANIGGVERMFVDKANYLSENGWDIIFLTYEQGSHPILFKLNHPIKHLDLECRFFTLFRYSIIRRFIGYYGLKKKFRQQLRSIIRKQQTQLLITTTYCSEFLDDILVVCKHNVKTIIESHTAYVHDMRPRHWIDRLTLYYKLRNIRRFNLLIALTESDAKSWKMHGVFVKVVSNHVASYPERIPSVLRKEGRIIAVGRLHKQKRFDRLIDAFAIIAHRYSNWHIDIYGRGEERKALLEQIKTKKLQGRIFIHEPIDNIFYEYQRSQFFVLSSDYEGFGLAIVEAMACETPVVSTDCPFGPAEIIDNNETGLLCEMDVNDLSSKMEWMITHELERKEMGLKAYQAASRYRKDNIMKLWESVYLSVI